MKKLMLVLVLAVFSLSLIFVAAAQGMEIAVIPLSLGHPWWVRCEEGAQKAAEDLGIDVVFTAPEREDVARQLDYFNDQVNRGVDAIVLAAVDSEAMARPIADAIEKGIPVFGFDIGAPGTDIIWTASGWEPAQSGTNIGGGIAEDIGYSGKVAILTGGLGSPFLEMRQRAIEEALAEHPDIEMIGVFATDNDYELALSQSESILQAHPDLGGFASTVTTGVPAAVQAAVNAGMAGEVAVWGVALPLQNAEAVKMGWVNGALALDPAQMTYLGVLIAYNYLVDGSLPEAGQDFGWAGVPVTIPEDRTSYVPDTLLTPENVDIFDF